MSLDSEPNIDPIVEEILGSYYKPEKILAQSVVKIQDNQFKVTFFFPKYERTLESQGHVSMSQMHEAILEGLYCTIGQSIKDKTIELGIDFDEFIQKMSSAIYSRENFSFRKMLNENETADLIFTITNIEQKKLSKNYYSVTVQVSGFIEGEAECLLENFTPH